MANGGGKEPTERMLTAAAVVVGAEAVGLVVAAAALAVHAVTAAPRAASGAGTGTAHPRAVEAVLAVLALVVGAALGAAARGLAQKRAWARGPVVTWQLIQAAVAIQILRGHGSVPMSPGADWWVGLPLLLGALVVLTAILVGGRGESRLPG
jgi:hypothetical protein